MASLLDVTPEPFGLIISSLNTRECIALWLTGDVKMRWKLSKGKAIRRMQLRWSKFSRCHWPSQVAQLEGLEEFKFYCSDGAPARLFSGLHLATLSRNLKKLELDCESSVQAFSELQLTSPGHFTSLETLHIGNLMENILPEFEIPQTVTDLKIQAYDLILPLLRLPPCLTSLRGCVRSIQWNEGDTKFPTNLTSLKMAFSGGSDVSVFRLFPVIGSTIQRISLPAVYGSPTARIDWTALSELSNLKYFKCAVGGLFSTVEASLLPRSLDELILSGIEPPTDEWCVEIIKALPTKLRRLEGIWPTELSAHVLQHLPKTLEKLEHHDIKPEMVKYLPDSFTWLDLEFADPEGISSFPTNLRHLNIYQIPDSVIEKLPTQLQTLKIRDISISSEIVAKLPRHLTHLDSYSSVPMVAAMEPLFAALPPSLTSFYACPPEFGPDVPHPTPSKSSRLLPRGMKELGIGCLDFSESSIAEWTLELPPALTHLKLNVHQLQQGFFASLGFLSSLDLLEVISNNSPTEGWANHLKFCHLPRNLTTMKLLDHSLAVGSRTDITNDAFKGAPSGLIRITIPVSPLVSKDCLVHLPNLCDFWVYPQFRTIEWFDAE